MKRKLIVLLVVLLIGTISVASTYTWPTTSDILSSGYGTREKPNAAASSNHKGVDIAVSYQPCYPIANGTVRAIRNQGAKTGYGTYIMIDIGNGVWTLYGHLSEVKVKEGQTVTPNDVVAISGNTGNSTGAHLHFEVRSNVTDINGYFNSATVLNPVNFLKGARLPGGGQSGSTQSNKCIKCGGTIGDKWYETSDGKHYKACTENHNHQYDIHNSDYTGFAGNCKVCGKKPLTELKTESNSSILPTWVNKNNPTVITEKHTLFNDLPDSHWGFNEVKAMKDLGIVSGQNDGKLGTNKEITAEEFLTLLSQVTIKRRVAKSQGESYIPANMEKNWSYDLYVNLTKVLGNSNNTSKKLGEEEIKLILGNSDSEVLENYKKPITREKVANIMGALVKSNKPATSANENNFKDWNSVNSTYKKRINTLKQMNIFRGEGYPDGTIGVNPKASITKVEAIALISRLYNAL